MTRTEGKEASSWQPPAGLTLVYYTLNTWWSTWIAIHLQPINTGILPGCLSPDATSSSMTLRRRHWQLSCVNLGFQTPLSEQFWRHQPWHSQSCLLEPTDGGASKNWREHLARTPRFEKHKWSISHDIDDVPFFPGPVFFRPPASTPKSWLPNRWAVNHICELEHGHRNNGFSHEKWWFSIVMVHFIYYKLPSKSQSTPNLH